MKLCYLDDDTYPAWDCCSVCMVKSILPIPVVADFEFLIVERLVYPWFLDGEAYLITGLLFPFFFLIGRVIGW